jgi:replication-associated recombination protein RarA
VKANYNSGSRNKPLVSKKKHGSFNYIIGFDDIIDLFDMAIKGDKPVHLLLCGAPGSAKILFIHSHTTLEVSYYAVGSISTKSGILDYLFEHRPCYFFIDELEKMNKSDQTSLLNLMESGILHELEHKQEGITQQKTWVFASCNRFKEIHLKPKHKKNL